METLNMVDFKTLLERMKGATVPKPLSGTLSGHAAGEPFDKAVYANLKRMYPSKIFRQYEYLNFCTRSTLMLLARRIGRS